MGLVELKWMCAAQLCLFMAQGLAMDLHPLRWPVFMHCAVQASGAGPVPSVTAEGNLAAQVCTSTGKFKSYLESYGEGKSNLPLERGSKLQICSS